MRFRDMRVETFLNIVAAVSWFIALFLFLTSCLADATLAPRGDGYDYGQCDGQQDAQQARFGIPDGKRQLRPGIVLWRYNAKPQRPLSITFDGHEPHECHITYTIGG